MLAAAGVGDHAAAVVEGGDGAVCPAEEDVGGVVAVGGLVFDLSRIYSCQDGPRGGVAIEVGEAVTRTYEPSVVAEGNTVLRPECVVDCSHRREDVATRAIVISAVQNGWWIAVVCTVLLVVVDVSCPSVELHLAVAIFDGEGWGVRPVNPSLREVSKAIWWELVGGSVKVRSIVVVAVCCQIAVDKRR